MNMTLRHASAPPTVMRATGARRFRAAVRLTPALLVIGLALLGPLLPPHPAGKPVAAPYAPPGPDALLGGDQVGRDVLSRLLAGGRDLLLSSLSVAVAVTALATVLGAFAALRPRVGAVLERAADTVILLPAVLGIMVIGLAVPGAGRTPVVLASIVLGTPFAFRVVAAAAQPLADSAHVEAALATGERTTSLVLREILPNLRATVLALLGLRFVAAVNVVATAGFLQIGAQPPAADWALMVRENAPGVFLDPWAVLAPGLAIAVLAASVNLALDALTPTTRSREVTRL